jgi:hypothetical protein
VSLDFVVRTYIDATEIVVGFGANQHEISNPGRGLLKTLNYYSPPAGTSLRPCACAGACGLERRWSPHSYECLPRARPPASASAISSDSASFLGAALRAARSTSAACANFSAAGRHLRSPR